jgi:hypothetical protein
VFCSRFPVFVFVSLCARCFACYAAGPIPCTLSCWLLPRAMGRDVRPHPTCIPSTSSSSSSCPRAACALSASLPLMLSLPVILAGHGLDRTRQRLPRQHGRGYPGYDGGPTRYERTMLPASHLPLNSELQLTRAPALHLCYCSLRTARRRPPRSLSLPPPSTTRALRVLEMVKVVRWRSGAALLAEIGVWAGSRVRGGVHWWDS